MKVFFNYYGSNSTSVLNFYFKEEEAEKFQNEQ